jgi:hypothetical protein
MLVAAYGISQLERAGLFHPRRPDCQRHLVCDFGNRPWSSYRRLAHAVGGGEMAVFRISGLSRSHGDLRPALAHHRIQPEQRGQAGLEDLVQWPHPPARQSQSADLLVAILPRFVNPIGNLPLQMIWLAAGSMISELQILVGYGVLAGRMQAVATRARICPNNPSHRRRLDGGCRLARCDRPGLMTAAGACLQNRPFPFGLLNY